MRKQFSQSEIIDREIMWLHAYGLQNARKELKRNQGIWAPDGGPCDLSEQRAKCSLPSHSKFYSWGLRNKEAAKSPLSFGQLRDAFWFYKIGIGLAIAAFFMETFVQKVQKLKSVINKVGPARV